MNEKKLSSSDKFKRLFWAERFSRVVTFCLNLYFLNYILTAMFPHGHHWSLALSFLLDCIQSIQIVCFALVLTLLCSFKHLNLWGIPVPIHSRVRKVFEVEEPNESGVHFGNGYPQFCVNSSEKQPSDPPWISIWNNETWQETAFGAESSVEKQKCE